MDAVRYANLSVICGERFQCNQSPVTFSSRIPVFNDIYSIVKADCLNNCLRLVPNPSAVQVPTESPVPILPSSTPTPDNTKLTVVFVSVAVLIAAIVILLVLYRLLNRKKEYKAKEPGMNGSLISVEERPQDQRLWIG
jgi:hypothetical protein